MFLFAFVDGESSLDPPAWLVQLLRRHAWDVLIDADHDSACVLVHPMGAVGRGQQPDLVVVSALDAGHETLAAAWDIVSHLPRHSMRGVPVILCRGMGDSILGMGMSTDGDGHDGTSLPIDLDQLQQSIERVSKSATEAQASTRLPGTDASGR